jgi:hypothetical protein
VSGADLLEVLARIQDAAAHRLPEAAGAALVAAGAERVLIRAVDHSERVLVALGDGPEPVPVDGSDAGDVYASQRPRRRGDTVLVPLTAAGDRRGVLEVTGGPFDVEALLRLSSFLAVSLECADRITDRYLVEGRQQRLTLAAEMQWALLPGRSYRDAEVDVAGLLEPAYEVVGDAFDWARTDGGLQLAVCEGSGRGVGSTLAASLALSAVRNARRAGLPLADQARLGDQALHSHYGGRRHVSALFLDLRPAEGRVTVVDAGSPRLLRLRRSGPAEEVELDHQLPLGMFEDTPYVEQVRQLEAGDRIVVLSEGVGATVSVTGERFGDELLPAVLRRTRPLPAAEAVRQVVRAMREHRGDPDPIDDAVVVCLDWHPGPAA